MQKNKYRIKNQTMLIKKKIGKKKERNECGFSNLHKIGRRISVKICAREIRNNVPKKIEKEID